MQTSQQSREPSLPLAKPLPHHTMRTDETIDGLLCLSFVVADVLIRDLLIPTIALCLTIAGWRPGSAGSLVAASHVRSVPLLPPAPAALPPASSAPVARDWAGRPLEWLTVRELRQMARTAGHRGLARSGRRADLIAALGG